ncbi:bifunctional diaminohydroxyphosphoribosylaminopyrimidine deaminase/5-amino-6-(5-phosphoribosylamino)uracil reductase RibD [Desertivirga brevis]|uniref:bifunctional diaminohydroxyphosphoribosylaminopyrimidine deaminase/5-amino-6-(5-phosphoribosylamino)uracil reductase RibD n=1 Tax=Desertivirga brevis TaxID=2810310 RepID=UPI001A97B453|nr:bifunctional diaminohydroxyphosphoribosylaminopyrimidine deaminase/5-amino-6-(5-phosphoribosylamino)uracil reductase RibD [Pedobacter sp. SYSU D00873]
MQRCIELAELGAGHVSPNPMVGSVVVHNDKIIGEGYHKQYGQNHAEVNAIRDVLNKVGEQGEHILKESTIFVSLEPCAHFGKTPPCADLIIRHGIPKVVIGCPDPFEHVNGRGIEKLRAAGIEVFENVLREECEFLNRRFFTRVKKQRPYIILKWAQTRDHYFAPEGNKQKWISSPLAKVLSHKWRSEEDAILVGKKTALIDNPQLNVREWPGRNPRRIVIDRNLELPENLHFFDQSQGTIVFNSKKTEIHDQIKYLEVEDFDHYLPQLISYQLYLMDIQSLIIEGGAKTLDLFIKAGLWDEARVFTSEEFWGKGIKAPEIKGRRIDKTKVGTDALEIFVNQA